LVPVFDGHNDVLLRLWMKKQGDPVADFLNGETGGHLDLPRMIKGGFQGGFFAIFAPSPEDADLDDDEDMNPPPANQVGQFGALNATIGLASILVRIEERSEGRFTVCRTAAEIRDAVAQGKIADDATISEIAGAHGKTNGQITLRWLIQHGIIAIPRTTKESRARENFDIFDFALTDEEMQRMDALDRGERLGDWLDPAFEWDKTAA
jgi:hypothetical protein